MKSITERHVQAIWYDSTIRPKELLTRRGSAVHVVHPGDWNLGPGPDFKNAVLEIGDNRHRIVGDVEVHLCPSDWDFHGHGSDPRYRNVIAHVTWGCGPIPSSLPAGAVSIWIGRLMTENTEFSPEQIDLMAYPYARLPIGRRPCEVKYASRPDEAMKLLAEAGRHRLRMKARRITGRLCSCCGRTRQVYYEEVMTALGYSRNTEPFRRVAKRIPIDELPQDVESAKMAMLVAGGFEEWNRTNVRPNNAPEIRLERAAEMFTSTSIMRLLHVEGFSRRECIDMVHEMRGDRKCIGRGRAAAILANVTLPFALAEERVSDIPDWLPPEDLSETVRLAAFRLFGRDHNPAALYSGNGLLIQGILQIHRDYCLQRHPDCAECDIIYP